MLSFNNNNRNSNRNRNSPIINKNNYDDDDSCTSTRTSGSLNTDNNYLLQEDISVHNHIHHSCMKTSKEVTIEERETQKNKMSKKKGVLVVQFSTVHIRQYSLCLGDNPSVSEGPPISLDWNYGDERSYKLEEYEQQKEGEVLRVSSKGRQQILKQIGYSRKEIKEAKCNKWNEFLRSLSFLFTSSVPHQVVQMARLVFFTLILYRTYNDIS